MKLVVAGISTALYWFWESRAEGNIRIDLIVIYPVLFSLYMSCFWKRYKFYSILIALSFMAVNTLFLVYSYSLFGKNPG